ncbi:MAG: tRNA (N6-threonylcarbamoyladenosine(37)-N6)-methyltransferase TrmO [Methanoregula sp.]|jgi:tRNA-Thr(GGU) m(6)t(6)A37 methyltransferase TsaA
MKIEYTPIGIVHCRPLTTPGNPPFQSMFSPVNGTIEVYPEFVAGLKAVKGFSHLIILCHFDRAQKQALTEQPLMDGNDQHGIFATRHFNRPNPIGIAYVRLEKIENGTLFVSGLDLLDNTPVLDIKPYIPAFDCIPDAVPGWVTPEHIGRMKAVCRNVCGDEKARDTKP